MKPAISPTRTPALPFLLAIGLTLAARSAGPVLYVSNEVANTLSVISPQTNNVVATIAVGKRPRGLAGPPRRPGAVRQQRAPHLPLGHPAADQQRGRDDRGGEAPRGPGREP